MALRTNQALELLDPALASGASSPAAVKRHVPSRAEHPTRFGSIRFDRNGDVQANHHVCGLAADQPPAPR